MTDDTEASAGNPAPQRQTTPDPKPSEIDWTAPETAEEHALLVQLLEDIELMYGFARERGIPIPETVIEGLSTLMARTGPIAPGSTS